MTTVHEKAPSRIDSLTTGHVGLTVTDIARSRDFYLRVLGLEVMGEGAEEGREFAFLGRDGKLLITLWQQSQRSFAPLHSGLHHLSFQVESIEEVQAVEETLRAMSADLLHDGVVPHGEGLRSGGIFFTDPDGIRLEVYAPTGADVAPAPTAGAPTCGFF